MPYDGKKILETIRLLNQVPSLHVLLREFGAFTRGYGFTSLIVGQIEDPQSASDLVTPPQLKPFLGSKHAVTFSADPIAARALHTTQPFQWSQIVARVSRQSAMPKFYGDTDGFMFPVHSLFTPTGGVALGGEQLHLGRYAIPEIELVAQTFYTLLEDSLGPFPYGPITIPIGSEYNISKMPNVSSGKRVSRTSLNRMLKRVWPARLFKSAGNPTRPPDSIQPA